MKKENPAFTSETSFLVLWIYTFLS